MSKFDRVLSDAELWAAAAEVEWQGTIGQYRLIEQAVLAKLAEQEPVMYARTYYGEIDWDEACVTEKNDGALMYATDMGKEDFVRHGYAVIPLYTHPMPCVSPTSDKTACVSEIAESDIQRHLDYIKRYQKWRRGEDKTMSEMGLTPKQIGEALDWLIGVVEDHIADMRKMVPEGWQLVPKSATDEMQDAACLTNGTTGDRYKAMLSAAPKYTGENT